MYSCVAINVIDFIIQDTERNFANFFHTCRQVPADKQDWRPLDNGRSTLDQAQEVAICPLWVPGLLQAKGFDPSIFGDFETAKASLPDLDACEAAAKENLVKLIEACKAFPEADYQTEVEFPWGKYTFLQTMTFASWNANYHMGQVSYIQTLYGDQSM
jgi:hypothetical protein